MSLGFTLSMLHSIPSTSTNGELVLNVPLPRTRMVAPSDPGCPEACVTFIPAASPERAEETLMMGRPSVWSAKLMEVTEPVKFTFFCTP